MIKLVEKLEEVLDFAWELSQDELYASYHRLKSREKVKEYIEEAINSKVNKIIASYHDNVLCGVCIFYGKLDEKYAQTIMFIIKENYDETADDFIEYIGEEFRGCDLLIGVPFSNINANEYFIKRKIECCESSIVTKLYNLKSHINPKHDLVEEITKDNFKEYEVFHDKYAVPFEMYYDSKNLEKEIDWFRIFVFKEKEVIYGSIFVKAGKELSDVIGLFIDDEYKNKGIEGVLIDEMLMQLSNKFGTVKEVLYFIDEVNQDELNAALAAGFTIDDTYRLYKCLL